MNRMTSKTEVVRMSMPFSRHFLATREPMSLTRWPPFWGTEPGCDSDLLAPTAAPEMIEAAEGGSVKGVNSTLWRWINETDDVHQFPEAIDSVGNVRAYPTIKPAPRTSRIMCPVNSDCCTSLRVAKSCSDLALTLSRMFSFSKVSSTAIPAAQANAFPADNDGTTKDQPNPRI